MHGIWCGWTVTIIMWIRPGEMPPIEWRNGSGKEELPEINYDYLCVTTQELLRTHRIESVVAMPECTATQANYYVREGVYFTSYDAEQMQSIFDRAWASRRTEIH